MKIGEFSKHNNTSKDTIRYYTDLGILTPLKKGHLVIYNDLCQSQFNYIMELKSMNFSLKEIEKISLHKEFCCLTPISENKYLNALYNNKLKEINEKLRQLEYAKENIKNYCATSIKLQDEVWGISFRLINKIVCNQ